MFVFQAEDGIRDADVTGVQTCALPIWEFDKRLPHEALFIEFPGLNSAHGPLATMPEPEALAELNEVWVRMVLRTQDKAVADGFGRLFPWMALSGPAYTCGFHGLNNSSELLGIWPALIDRQTVEAQVHVEIIPTWV